MARAKYGLSKALNSLVLRGKVITGRLPVPNSRPAIAAYIGVGTPAAATGSSGGGIASPITEQNDSRQFYDHDLTSGDGLFVIENIITSKLTALDAAGNSFVMLLDDPYV